MASIDRLLGASFDGELAPPGLAPSPLTYWFGEEPAGSQLPPAVLKQRRSLGWASEDVICVKAICDIPAVGIKAEEVVVSVDPPSSGGSRRLLLQSLARPDLGLTVLSLDRDCLALEGGDETWRMGQPPVVRARRREEPQAAPARTSAAEALEARAPSEPRPPDARGYPPRRTHGSAAAAPVAPSAGPEPEEDPLPRTPSPSRTPSPERAPVKDGVGHQRTGGQRLSRLREPKPVVAADSFQRPDIVVGPQVASSKPARGDTLDAEVLAAGAEAAERLVAAADAGEVGEVRALVARAGPDAAAPSGPHEGMTPLMAAAARGRDEVAALLLEQRASLEARDPRGWSAVMHAVAGQRPAALRLLLGARAAPAGGAHADAESGATPLMLAAGGARAELCTVLLKHGHPQSMLAASDAEGRSAVHHAAKSGRCGSLVVLLAARARVDTRGEDGCAPLLEAARAGRAECVRFLMAHQANPRAQDPEGRTAATLAKIHGHDRALQALTEKREVPAFLRD